MPVPSELIYEGDYSRRCARIATEQFLTLKQPPTAIFAASDEMALEVIGVLLEKGLKVPQNCSVIGFDDNPAGIYGPVALTTIKQPLFQMAEDAVRYLQAYASGKKTTSLKTALKPQLIIRESCDSFKS